jgi:DNA-binding transcriptional MocR family regulator
MDGIIPPLRPLSFKLRMRLDHTLKAINELIEAGLIEENNGVYSVHSWDKRQYKSDLSTHRVKRFRNVSETPPDTDTDIDIEKEIYKEKESTKKVRNKFYAKPTSEEISERVRDELGLPVRSDRSGDTML